MFGGFWQDLKKRTRRDSLNISGSPIAELDYGQMAVTLLYAMEDTEPPEGDLYALPNLWQEGDMIGPDTIREGVKKVMNASLYSDTLQARMPMGTREFFPPRINYHQVMSAIKERHQPISHRLFTGVGMHLMFLESEIMSKRTVSTPSLTV